MAVLARATDKGQGYMGFTVDPPLEKRIRDYCNFNAVNFSEISRRLWETFLAEKENK